MSREKEKLNKLFLLGASEILDDVKFQTEKKKEASDSIRTLSRIDNVLPVDLFKALENIQKKYVAFAPMETAFCFMATGECGASRGNTRKISLNAHLSRRFLEINYKKQDEHRKLSLRTIFYGCRTADYGAPNEIVAALSIAGTRQENNKKKKHLIGKQVEWRLYCNISSRRQPGCRQLAVRLGFPPLAGSRVAA